MDRLIANHHISRLMFGEEVFRAVIRGLADEIAKKILELAIKKNAIEIQQDFATGQSIVGLCVDVDIRKRLATTVGSYSIGDNNMARRSMGIASIADNAILSLGEAQDSIRDLIDKDVWEKFAPHYDKKPKTKVKVGKRPEKDVVIPETIPHYCPSIDGMLNSPRLKTWALCKCTTTVKQTEDKQDDKVE